MRRKLGKRLAGIRGLLDRLGACLLTTDDAEAFAAAAAVDMCLLSGSADDESLAFLPPDRTASTTGARNTGDDVESAFALLQKELAARCGGTRSTSLARWGRTRGAARRGGDGGYELKGGEAGVRVRVRDHRGKTLETTCLNDIERRRCRRRRLRV
ncbi:hypothetical protein EDB84DRAFT_1578506 [Lactarius hengduanensis]|nr:hypothetical protein EDB84DRAFT_1578506 [Lactarius hengduanensis]